MADKERPKTLPELAEQAHRFNVAAKRATVIYEYLNLLGKPEAASFDSSRFEVFGRRADRVKTILDAQDPSNLSGIERSATYAVLADLREVKRAKQERVTIKASSLNGELAAAQEKIQESLQRAFEKGNLTQQEYDDALASLGITPTPTPTRVDARTVDIDDDENLRKINQPGGKPHSGETTPDMKDPLYFDSAKAKAKSVEHFLAEHIDWIAFIDSFGKTKNGRRYNTEQAARAIVGSLWAVHHASRATYTPPDPYVQHVKKEMNAFFRKQNIRFGGTKFATLVRERVLGAYDRFKNQQDIQPNALFAEIQTRKADSSGRLEEPVIFHAYGIDNPISLKQQALLLSLLNPTGEELQTVSRTELINTLIPPNGKNKLQTIGIQIHQTNRTLLRNYESRSDSEPTGAVLIASEDRDNERYYDLIYLSPEEMQEAITHTDASQPEEPLIPDVSTQEESATEHTIFPETPNANPIDIVTITTAITSSPANPDVSEETLPTQIFLLQKSFYTLDDVVRETHADRRQINQALEQVGIKPLKRSGRRRNYKGHYVPLQFSDDEFQTLKDAVERVKNQKKI